MRKDSQPAELDSASVCKNATLRFVSHLYGSYSDMMGRGGGGREGGSELWRSDINISLRAI